jgi:hypothetical protein
MDTQTAALWQFIATVAGVLVVVWYSFETRWLRHETAKLLKEARTQNETSLRPIVDFYFESVGTRAYEEKYLKVRNVGFGPAFNLYAVPLKCKLDCSLSMTLPQSLPAGGSEFCAFDMKNFLGPLTEAMPRGIFTGLRTVVDSLPIAVKVTYTNAAGKRSRTTLIVSGDDEIAKLVFGGSACIDDEAEN